MASGTNVRNNFSLELKSRANARHGRGYLKKLAMMLGSGDLKLKLLVSRH